MRPEDKKLADSIYGEVPLDVAAGAIVDRLYTLLPPEEAFIALDSAYVLMKQALIQRYKHTTFH